ncbi:MAG: hypothetical protein ACI9LN_003520, partial [Saprospiraceae bacterium]
KNGSKTIFLAQTSLPRGCRWRVLIHLQMQLVL